jgi:hypothetical protein
LKDSSDDWGASHETPEKRARPGAWPPGRESGLEERIGRGAIGDSQPPAARWSRARTCGEGCAGAAGVTAAAICIATSYDSAFREIGDFAAMTVRRYASTHGYAAFIDDHVSCGRPPAWHRVQLIPELFARGFEFVLWVDADAIFVRFDVDIANVITTSHDLYLVQHYHPQHSPPLVPNTGVMLVRNGAWARDLFARLWVMEQYRDHPWWENAALIHLLGYKSLLGEGEDAFADELLVRIKFLNEAWNFIPAICTGPDPIIRHYAGSSLEQRRQEIQRQVRAVGFPSTSS